MLLGETSRIPFYTVDCWRFSWGKIRLQVTPLWWFTHDYVRELFSTIVDPQSTPPPSLPSGGVFQAFEIKKKVKLRRDSFSSLALDSYAQKKFRSEQPRILSMQRVTESSRRTWPRNLRLPPFRAIIQKVGRESGHNLSLWIWMSREVNRRLANCLYITPF